MDLNRDLRTERDTLLAVCAEREAIIHRIEAQLREMERRLKDERRWSLKRPLRGAKRLLAALSPKRTALGH